MGLQIPPFAIVRGLEIEIPMLRHNGIIRPPAFFSRHIEGSASDGTDLFPKRLTSKDDMAKLVVFDTWIRNCDRCYRPAAGVFDYNRDNLLFGVQGNGHYVLAPIDHSHCIIDVDFDDDLLSANLVSDQQVYGFFPEFEPYISSNSVAKAIEAMLSVNRESIEEIVNSVPAEWLLGEQPRVNLVQFLLDRAEFIAATLPIKLVDRPELNLPGAGR